MYYTYLLKSKKNNQIYTGSTNDLKRRLTEHNNGREFSTKRYMPWELVYYEAYKTDNLARIREKRLKYNGNALREVKKRIGLLPRKSGAGFTLIEMLVSVAIFTLLVSASSGIFVSSLRAQRQSLATQEVLDQSSYLMEYMSRALRMAKKDLSGNCITAKMNYENPGGDISKLRFIKFNYELNQDICQEFLLEGNQLKERKSSDSSAANLGAAVPLTSPKLQVSQFNINLSGQYQPPIDYLQPRLTIFLEIKGKEQSNIKIQTTISQRNPDVRK